MMPLFTCENLTVTINQKFVCKEFNFTLDQGDRCALLGPNGSGKTTLLKTFARLIAPQSGNLFLQGENFSSFSHQQFAQHIGMLFQQGIVAFDQTVLEFCLLGRYPHKKSIPEHNEQICLQALKQLDLNHLHARKVSTLSGGELKRLHIAMLLAQSPKMYLLDEPTNHLDIKHQIKLFEHLQSLSHAGIIIALHDIRWAKYFCNKVILLFPDGELITGETNKVLTKKNCTQLYSIEESWLTLINS